MIIYDKDKELLYVPEAGDKVLFDPDEVYRKGYQMGYEEGLKKAEEEVCNIIDECYDN